ncbi:DM DNA binding domain-containing protein [Ditylenchus destructor]|nr:DM DNA binding domain-containing protein [Ditylenchus destructor]
MPWGLWLYCEGQTSTGAEIPHKRVYYCQRCLNHGRIEPRKNHKTDCIYANCDCEKCILVERRRVLNTQLHELEEQDEQKNEHQNSQDSASPTLDEKDTEAADNSQNEARESSVSGSNSPLSVIGRSRSNTMFNVGGASGMDGFFFGNHNSMVGQNQPNQSSSSSPTSSAMYGGIGRMKGERVPNCQKCAQHGKKARLKGHKRYCAYKECSCAKCQVISERQKLMADQIKIRRRQSKDTWMKLRRERLGTTHIGRSVEVAPSMDFTAKPMENESSNANAAVSSPLATYLQNLSQLYRTLMEPSEAPTVPPMFQPQMISMDHWAPKSAASSPPSSMISNSIFSDSQGYRKFSESLSLPALSQGLDANSFLQSLVQPRSTEMEVKSAVSSSSPVGHSASPTAMEALSRILQQQIQPPTTTALATYQGSPEPLPDPGSFSNQCNEFHGSHTAILEWNPELLEPDLDFGAPNSSDYFSLCIGPLDNFTAAGDFNHRSSSRFHFRTFADESAVFVAMVGCAK